MNGAKTPSACFLCAARQVQDHAAPAPRDGAHLEAVAGSLRELTHKVKAKAMTIAFIAFRIGSAELIALRRVKARAIVDHLEEHTVLPPLDSDQDL